ncbi:diguanylate cyclase domain-containing protein [Planococcus sp. YIM B11945]|uniref:GGDEF domain-containing protein n=1 Tax=Planococcus sp. YIM B11945 TaxID=3435410 RepID=UPI003D7D9D15
MLTMKVLSLLSKNPAATLEKEKLFRQYLLKDNVQRCKLFAEIVILFESVLIIVNLASGIMADQQVIVNIYLIMYALLLSASLGMLLFLHKFEKEETLTEQQGKRFHQGLMAFVIFFLIWGAVVTLIDQAEYGHIMAFAVNFMSVSILFHASNKRILLLYILPIAFLFGGLPVVQPSQDVLMGHYTNLSVFLFFCWLASRMLYQINETNFYNKLLLMETNENLAGKIEENEEINRELEEANEQLRKLTVLDDLTKIPNRRGLQQYIDEMMLESIGKRKLSFIMLDLDAFKLFNDNYGHFEGDKVLRTVAQQIGGCLESSNTFLSRFGGEEFIIAIFDHPNSVAVKAAKCICKSVSDMQIPHGFSPVSEFVTVSVGVISGEVENANEIEALKEEADMALYKAKLLGRNRVEAREYVLPNNN